MKYTVFDMGSSHAGHPILSSSALSQAARSSIPFACSEKPSIPVCFMIHQNFKGVRAEREQLIIGMLPSRYGTLYGFWLSLISLVVRKKPAGCSKRA